MSIASLRLLPTSITRTLSAQRRTLVGAAVIALGLTPGLSAMDTDVRIVPQLLVGSSGFEPGVALEVRPASAPHIIIRPEVFLSEDTRVGFGGAVLFDLRHKLDMNERCAFAVGPRVVWHNSDDSGVEVDALATFAYDLAVDSPWRHSIGALAALGVRDDRSEGSARLGASVGVFYAYRF